jgi:beta-phosphoglucomutase-like phosphatase (HAD superfamily)
MVFDLDGVLVQTEKLKALAYAKAVQKIRGLPEPDLRAGEAYREVVGAPREVTSNYVMNKLGLEEDLRPLMAKYGASKPVDALTAIRYEIYDDMVADLQVLRDNQWSYTVELLRIAKESAYQTALTTLSKRRDVEHVVNALGIDKVLDQILTAEDVTKGKPDPEIYLLTAERLGLPPEECLVLEDSVNGVKAAIAAGMNVVAIATPFTNASLHTSQIADEAWIVHEPERVAEVVRHRIEEHNLTAHEDKGGV